jgi:1,4-alpha-glucan branching enzyme
MPLSQANISSNTPMGATLVPGGATFKVWGPLAQAVYLNGTFGGVASWPQATNPALLLTQDRSGYWTGFWPGWRKVISTNIMLSDKPAAAPATSATHMHAS